MKMSNSPKQKRLFFYALLVLCLGIWGYVLFQMEGGLHEDEEGTGAPAVPSAPGRMPGLAPVMAGAEVRYDSSFRDPFAPPAALFGLMTKTPIQSRPRPDPNQVAAAPTPPPLTLGGIVGETALLHDEAGAVHIGRVGERAGAVRILEVQHDHVVIHFEGRSHTLRLTR